MSRILHIWDQASVSCVLAKYQRKIGHEVSVIKRDGFDKFGIMHFYNETILKTHGTESREVTSVKLSIS